MKSLEEIIAIMESLNDETFEAVTSAWYDDMKKCRRLLKKIGLTMDEFETWLSW